MNWHLLQKKIPLEFHLNLLGEDRAYQRGQSDYPFDSKRLKNVSKTVAKKSNWGKKLPKGHGLGLAIHYSFYSYVATVVEVSSTEG